jgi:hypothetical protein
MNDHMKEFMHKGKKYVKNLITRQVWEAPDIHLPSMNEMLSYGDYTPKEQEKEHSKDGIQETEEGTHIPKQTSIKRSSKKKNLE